MIIGSFRSPSIIINGKRQTDRSIKSIHYNTSNITNAKLISFGNLWNDIKSIISDKSKISINSGINKSKIAKGSTVNNFPVIGSENNVNLTQKIILQNIINIKLSDNIIAERMQDDIKYSKENNFSVAKEIFEEKEYIQKSKTSAKAKYHLGKLELSNLKHNEAYKYFKMAMLLDPENPKYPFTLGNLCIDTARPKEALKYHTKALDILKKHSNYNNFEAVKIYNGIGMDYEALYDDKKAFEAYNKALNISEKTFGPNHPQTGIIYNNIGNMYKAQGNTKKAFEYYDISLGILEKTLDIDDTSIARTYKNIGDLYLLSFDFENAFKYYNTSLAMREKRLGHYHIETANSYDNIGDLYHFKGDLNKALECYGTSLDIKEKTLDYPAEIAISYGKIAEIYGELGDFESAFKYCNTSLAMKEKRLGHNNPEVARSYRSLGTIYIAQRKYEDAMEPLQKALNILKERLGADHSDTELTLFCIESCKKELEKKLETIWLQNQK